MSSKMPLDLNGEWVLVKNNEMERYLSEFGEHIWQFLDLIIHIL